MNILIVYTSKYGTTERAAQMLEKKLKGDIQLLNLKRGRMPEIEKYDFIIIGSPIYMGRPEKKLQEFCEDYASKLKEKDIGLFLCCGHVGEKAQQQMEKAFTSELVQHAKVTGSFGGEIHQEQLKFLDKMIINMISKMDPKVHEDVPEIDLEQMELLEDEINNFVNKVKTLENQ